MPEEQPRLKYSIDEVFGIMIPDEDEIETPRTPDFGSIRSPNWSEPTKIFQIGLHNSESSILSNMIAKKTKQDSLSLYDFLDFARSTQRMLMDFITQIIERLLDKIGEVKTK